jgi:adenylate cyclase
VREVSHGVSEATPRLNRVDDPPPPTPNEFEPVWRGMLLGTDPQYARTRSRLRHLPSEPRCKMCGAPFGGIGHQLMRLVGRVRWPKNPKYCGICFDALSRWHGGAEIEASFLFADVRGSTSLAEQISPTEFRLRLDHFYDTASTILVDHDGIVDKFVGDEVVGMFIPALTQNAHANRAITAAIELLRAMDPAVDARSLPIGIGVGTGVAFVGSVGAPPVTEFTALGDVVNTTARLASAAGAGEVLVAEPATAAAAFDVGGLEHRSLDLKGKSDTTPVFVITVNATRTTEEVRA